MQDFVLEGTRTQRLIVHEWNGPSSSFKAQSEMCDDKVLVCWRGGTCEARLGMI